MCTHVFGDPAGHAGLDVAVDVRVGAGKLEPEGDVAVPACAERPRASRCCRCRSSGSSELLETVADDRVQQRLLAAEVVVERRGARGPARSVISRVTTGPPAASSSSWADREQQPVAGGEDLCDRGLFLKSSPCSVAIDTRFIPMVQTAMRVYATAAVRSSAAARRAPARRRLAPRGSGGDRARRRRAGDPGNSTPSCSSPPTSPPPRVSPPLSPKRSIASAASTSSSTTSEAAPHGRRLRHPEQLLGGRASTLICSPRSGSIAGLVPGHNRARATAPSCTSLPSRPGCRCGTAPSHTPPPRPPSPPTARASPTGHLPPAFQVDTDQPVSCQRPPPTS